MYTRTRIIEYPKLQVVLFWGYYRVVVFITRIFNYPNYQTRNNRVTRMPRPSPSCVWACNYFLEFPTMLIFPFIFVHQDFNYCHFFRKLQKI
jgi:hypothetical protein